MLLRIFISLLDTFLEICANLPDLHELLPLTLYRLQLMPVACLRHKDRAFNYIVSHIHLKVPAMMAELAAKFPSDTITYPTFVLYSLDTR